MQAMTWLFKAVLVAVVAVILGSVAAAPASAAEVGGSGRLVAQGFGAARIEGSGSIVIAGGAGTVWVSGPATITTEGRGRRTTLPDGTIRLSGYSGRITITGDDLVVRVAGGAINLSATGTGRALLSGKGTYTAGNLSGLWSTSGVSVQY